MLCFQSENNNLAHSMVDKVCFEINECVYMCIGTYVYI